jgi:AraC-like DNA-binding protein
MDDLTEIGAGGLEFDSNVLPAERRFAVWASAMPFYEVATPDPSAFRASVRAWLLAPVIVVDATLSEIALRRTATRLARDGNDDIVLQLLDGARMSGTADAPFAARPGEMVLHDRGQPFEAALGEGRNVTVSMPRAFLDEALPAAAVHGLVLRDGLARPLASFLGALPAALSGEARDSADLGRLLRDLLAAAVRRSGTAVAPKPSDAALRLRAARFVRRNLARPLDAQSLCDAIGVSRSTLYRAFESEGGVARFVTAERLKRLHRLLADPAERGSIARLAAAHGFADNAHFSRLFKRSFGYSPQELRRRSAESGRPRAPAPDNDSAPAIFNRWEAGRG